MQDIEYHHLHINNNMLINILIKSNYFTRSFGSILDNIYINMYIEGLNKFETYYELLSTSVVNIVLNDKGNDFWTLSPPF